MGENLPALGEGEEDVATSAEAEEWCFVCKDGGNLLLCDHKKCPKAYHPHCVGKKNSFMSSEEHWQCAWHSCPTCGNPSNFCCYVCPKSVCLSCMDPKHFFHIKEKYGFCNECIELALDIEVNEEKTDVENSSMKYFKGYYEFVKEQEGFDLYSLRSAKGLETEKAHIPTSNSGDAGVHYLNNDHDKSVVSKNIGKLVEDKRCEGMQKRKFNHVEASDEDLVMRSSPEARFASIVPENIRLVYLTKSLVLELLKKPESFESKVIGSFVRVKYAVDANCQRTSYRLVQVAGNCLRNSNRCCGTGITTDLSSSSPVKFQLREMPNDVCIDYLSDAPFSEEECEALRQKFDVGLLNKPTVEELEHKAKDLHADLTKNMIARELKTLKILIDQANEKGRRHKLIEHLERKERLETESEVRRMLNTHPKVIPEVPKVEPVANVTMDDKKRKKGLPKTLHVSIDVEVVADINETLDHNHKNMGELVVALASGQKISGNTSVSGTKGTSVSDTGHVVEDEVIQEPFIDHIDLQGNNTPGKDEVIQEPFSDRIDLQCNKSGKDEVIQEPSSHRIDLQGKATSHLNTTTSKNSLTGKSSGDVALKGMLDELIRPDLLNCSDTIPSEVKTHIIKGCILSLKEIPISKYKDMMIPLANGFFVTLRNLNVDYTQLYGRVKDYIHCCAQLACFDNSEEGPTFEELGAMYEEKKLCYEKNSEDFNVISKSNKQPALSEEGHNQVESELSGERSEHVSRISSMFKISEELEKSKKELVQALDALENSRKKWLEKEKLKEDFTSAKAALVW